MSKSVAARFTPVCLALCLAALPAMAASTRQNNDRPLPNNGQEFAPTGKGYGEHKAQGQAKGGGKPGGGSNGINYNGGPVMTGTVKMYYIWYGNLWSNSSPEIGILENFARNIGGSPYYNINTTYYNAQNVHISNSIAFGGSQIVPSYLGNSLSDAQIKQVVNDYYNSFGAADTSGVYFVITDKNTTASSGFCTQYCGWHTHGTIANKDIKYSFIGDSSKCASSCSAQTTGPNGSSGADGMASIIAHELEEATSDPDLNAWYDRRGYENADKCAWTFGSTQTATNGAKYNMTLGGTKYLIQQNWVNASGGYCAVAYP